jgi:hypothetical protein
VPLARLDKRVFTTDESLAADLEVSHYGPAPLRKAVLRWRLVGGDGSAAAGGVLGARNIPVDSATPLGRINVDLAGVEAPAKYTLVAGIEGTPFENDWDVWVYPREVDTTVPASVALVRELDKAALDRLRAGGTVLLAIPPARVKGDAKGPVQLGFSSIFWNTAWTNGQAPHTLGILCDPKHPALAVFPTDSHTNWQWWYLVTNAAAMILDGLPPQTRPIVQVIDDWFQTRRLGLAFEARVESGRLLVTSIDLERLDNPVSRQMRSSLLRYAGSAAFNPPVRLTPEQVRGLMK